MYTNLPDVQESVLEVVEVLMIAGYMFPQCLVITDP